jgi:hypothetical protein
LPEDQRAEAAWVATAGAAGRGSRPIRDKDNVGTVVVDVEVWVQEGPAYFGVSDFQSETAAGEGLVGGGKQGLVDDGLEAFV